MIFNKPLLALYFLSKSKDRGLAYCITIVCLSVTNLTYKMLPLNHLSYKAHTWYEGTFHRFASLSSKVKVMYQGQGQI